MQPPTHPELEEVAKKFLDDKAAQEYHADILAQKHPIRYETYLTYYTTILGLQPNTFNVNIWPAAFLDHVAIRSVLDRLTSDPTRDRRFLHDIFAASIEEAEQNRGIQALVRVAFMIDCASKEEFGPTFKIRDFVPRSWALDQSFVDFAESCFPKLDPRRAMQQDVQDALANRESLKAWKLKKRYNVILRPTDNLAEHLVYDKVLQTLKIFRHVGFLKAHLRRSQKLPIDADFAKSTKEGTLPPQLLLEVLDSTQELLFPGDPKSVSLLDRLIEEQDFDPGAKYREGHIREFVGSVEYKYLGDRLVTLFDLVENPPPANRVVRWIERHKSERNALTIAAFGLFLTALFGFLTLITGIVSMVYAIKQYNIAVRALQLQIQSTPSTPVQDA